MKRNLLHAAQQRLTIICNDDDDDDDAAHVCVQFDDRNTHIFVRIVTNSIGFHWCHSLLDCSSRNLFFYLLRHTDTPTYDPRVMRSLCAVRACGKNKCKFVFVFSHFFVFRFDLSVHEGATDDGRARAHTSALIGHQFRLCANLICIRL